MNCKRVLDKKAPIFHSLPAAHEWAVNKWSELSKIGKSLGANKRKVIDDYYVLSTDVVGSWDLYIEGSGQFVSSYRTDDRIIEGADYKSLKDEAEHIFKDRWRNCLDKVIEYFWNDIRKKNLKIHHVIYHYDYLLRKGEVREVC